MANAAERELNTADEAQVIDDLDADLPNLRSVFGWLVTHDPAAALEMASDLYAFWISHDLLREGLTWLTTTTDAPPGVVARALASAAVCAFFVGENERAEAHAQASIAASEAATEPPDPKPLNILALLAVNQGRVEEGLELCERAAAAVRRAGEKDDVIMLSAIGVAFALAGEIPRGLALCERAVRESRAAAPTRRASTLVNLAAALQRRDPERAVKLCAEVAEVAG